MNDPLENPLIVNVLKRITDRITDDVEHDRREVAMANLSAFATPINWWNMSFEDQKRRLQYLLDHAESEVAFIDCLTGELGDMKYSNFCWYNPTTNDDERLSVLYQAVGGLVSKTGALVSITLDGTPY